MIEKPIRPLIEQGSSLTLTLPKEWTTKHGLLKGQYVRIDEDGDALRVLPWKED
jgi:phosphate uptake regulator